MIAPGQRMVVAHSSDEHYGSDRVLLDVLRVATRLDLDVVVLLPNDLPHGRAPLCVEITRRYPTVRVEHAALPVLRRSRRSPLAAAMVAWRSSRLVVRLRDLQPDLVWCATSAALPVAAAARIAGAHSIVVHLHEIWSGPVGWMMRAMGRLTTANISVSTAVAHAARLPGAGVVIANAVDAQPAVVRHGLAEPPLRFVVASRWGWWKGHETLLRAWDVAGCPGLLTVLGAPPSSGGGVDVNGLVARHVGDPSTVRVIGEVADIGAVLDQSDVLVLPSCRPEPFGLVLIEAFARGIPVIATNAGGVPQIVTDGVDGWLVEPGDVVGLAAVLSSISPADIAAAGVRARATHRARFSPDLFDLRIANVLRSQLDHFLS